MTDEAKALALVDEVRAERELPLKVGICRLSQAQDEALCRAIEQHEAFRQEVSDAVEAAISVIFAGAAKERVTAILGRFIIAKPDPVAEALAVAASDVDAFRAALASRGLEVRKIGEGE